MSDIPSSAVRIQTEQAQFRSAVSESLMQGVGASVNYLLDYKISNDSSISTINGQISSINSTISGTLQPQVDQAAKITNKIAWTSASTSAAFTGLYTCPAGKTATIRVFFDGTGTPPLISVYMVPGALPFSTKVLTAGGSIYDDFYTVCLFPGEQLLFGPVGGIGSTTVYYSGYEFTSSGA